MSGCLLWLGYVNKSGYGRFDAHGRKVLVHRFAYEREYGPVPEGMELDHLCRVRCCVNPKHLEPVTHGDNIRRGDAAKNRLRKTHCANGHPLDEKNTWRPAYAPHRHCRRCQVVASQRYQARTGRGKKR